MKEPIILGATAEVQLPNFGLKGLQARVDTGAATCALHASYVRVIEGEDENEDVLEVVLFDPDSDLYTGEKLLFKDFIVRNVRNSFGKRSSRPMIKTTVQIHRTKLEVLVGFTDRSKLTYDMLIGRNLLERGFVVDVTK
jgi:hypothetical protein